MAAPTVTTAPRAWRKSRGGGQTTRTWGVFEVLAALVTLLVTLAIAYPVIRVFATLVQGGWAKIAEAYTLPDLWRDTMVNTAVVVIGGVLIAMTLGTVFAWLNECTDARIGFVGEIAPIVPLLVPHLIASVGFVMLAAPNSGYLNVLIRHVLGWFGIELTQGPLNIYTLPSITVVYGILLVPFAYLPIAAALSRLDPSLSEASRVHGGRTFQTFVRITLPSIKPALAAATMITTITALAMFAVPITLGVSARIEILSVRIYRLLSDTHPPEREMALALCLMILAVVGVMWVIQARILRNGRYATLGGKGLKHAPISLGRWRWPARAAMIGFILVSSVVPFVGVLLASFQNYWSPQFSGNVSLDRYRELWETPLTRDGLINSFRLGVLAAIFAMLVAAIVVTYVARRPNRSARFADGMTKVPGIIPPLVLAVAFIVAYKGTPLHWGAPVVLLLGYVLISLPNATLIAGSSHSAVGNELTEASAMAGAAPGRTFGRITLPLMAPGLAGGLALVFILMFGEVNLSALIADPGSPVVGFAVLHIYENGSFPKLAAVGVLMAMVSAIVVFLVMWLGKGRTNTNLH